MAARPFVVPLARAPHASGGFSDLLAQGERRHVVLSFISPKYFKSLHFNMAEMSWLYFSALTGPITHNQRK